MAHKLSRAGAELIARFEGVVLHPYNDPSGHATVGVGHLIHRGNVTPADKKRYAKFSRADALALLQKDAGVASHYVNSLVKVPLTQDQFDALVSFVFNVGGAAFSKSTLLKELNAGHYGRVPAELMRWDKSDGVVLDGLRQRRAMEGHVFARVAKRTKPLRAAGNIGNTHFTWAEARSKSGKQVPLRLRPNAIKHAKNLEKLRAAINVARAKHGLKPTGINILSWYRDPAWNDHVGGARNSQHLYATATDISLDEIRRLCPWPNGRAVFEALADTIFREGGFGQYPGGNRHVDSRGYRARWTSWTR